MPSAPLQFPVKILFIKQIANECCAANAYAGQSIQIFFGHRGAPKNGAATKRQFLILKAFGKRRLRPCFQDSR